MKILNYLQTSGLNDLQVSSSIDLNLELIVGWNLVCFMFWISCWDWIHQRSPRMLRCLRTSYDEYKKKKQTALIQCFMGSLATYFLLLPLCLYVLLTVDSLFEVGYKGNGQYMLVVGLAWGVVVFTSTFHYFYGVPIRTPSRMHNACFHFLHIVTFFGFAFFAIASTYDEFAELIIYFRYCLVITLIGSIFTWYFALKSIQASLIMNKENQLAIRNFYHIMGVIRSILQWNLLLWPPLVYVCLSDSVHNRSGLFIIICVFSIPDCLMTTVGVIAKACKRKRPSPKNEELDYDSFKTLKRDPDLIIVTTDDEGNAKLEKRQPKTMTGGGSFDFDDSDSAIRSASNTKVREPGMPQYEDNFILWGISE